ncbi:MAG: glycosyltransferase family 2 protein [Mangrovibacterium sp.]
MTIIVPVYNEEDNLERVREELSSYLATSKYKSKVLFVNDGSTDGSQALIEAICHKSGLFSFVRLDANYGLSTAIKAGIDHADTPFVGYIDADLQTTPFDFDCLLEYRNEYALVTGIRQYRKDGLIKKMSSKIANSFRRLMIQDQVEDTGCPLKVINTAYAKKLPSFNGMHRFIPALILMQKGTIKQIPVRHFPRMAGEAKYHLFNRLLGPFADCFVYRWMKKRYLDYRIQN